MTSPEDQIIERFQAKRRKRLERGEQYRTYMRWSGRALEVPVSVVVGLLLGRFIGHTFNVEPWGTWLGLFFGVAAAVRALYRITVAYQKEHPDDVE
jgi:F0F1-type ATP synthase assembly protein I